MKNFNGYLGVLIMILLLPSFINIESTEVTFKDIRFNILGFVDLVLGIILFTSITVEENVFWKWIYILILPILAVLSFTFFKTPDLSEVEFELGANFETSGGFGSNQVSSMLGLGLFLMGILYISKSNLTKYRLIDLSILILFGVQGFLTFSRGGMLSAVIALIAFIYPLYRASYSEYKVLNVINIKKWFLPIAFSMIFIFLIANMITGGILLLRYQGETRGTLSGKQEKTLNKITTNRSGIVIADIELWGSSPITGVGVGSSKYLREDHNGVLSHVEVSRILAEHGIFGLIIIFILTYIVIERTMAQKDKKIKGLILGFFTIAILSSFHAATRTFITPLLFSMACVKVIPHYRSK